MFPRGIVIALVITAFTTGVAKAEGCKGMRGYISREMNVHIAVRFNEFCAETSPSWERTHARLTNTSLLTAVSATRFEHENLPVAIELHRSGKKTGCTMYARTRKQARNSFVLIGMASGAQLTSDAGPNCVALHIGYN